MLMLTASRSPSQPAMEPSPENPVEVQLVVDTTAIAPGTTFTLGFLLKLQPGWHVYWANPGEIGYATSFELTPTNAVVKAGPIQYPVPMRFVSPGPLNSFGYEDEVLLMRDVSWEGAGTGSSAELELRVKGRWLMCSDRCIPGKAELSLKLPVGKPQPANAELFSRYRRLLPRPDAGSGMLSVKSERTDGATSVVVTVTPPAGRRLVATDKPPALRGVYFYPLRITGYDVSVPAVSQADSTVKIQSEDLPVFSEPVRIDFRVNPEKRAEAIPGEIPGVLVTQSLGSDGAPAEPVPGLVVLKP